MSKSNLLGYTAVLKPDEGVIVVIDGKSFPVAVDSINYEPLVNALRDRKPLDEIKKLTTPKQAVIAAAGEHGFQVTIDEKTDTLEVFCEGKQITGLIADRIVELVRAKQGFKALQNFIIKSMKHHDPGAIDQLYKFIEHNRCTIHPDGDVLGFKAVRQDYFDKHSGTVQYVLGKVVEMPRAKCNPDPRSECSTGLHVGGRSYVQKWYGSDARILVVKINPADFVAVPEYDQTKARTCRMLVYSEIMRADLGDALQAFVGICEDGEKYVEANAEKTAEPHDQPKPKKSVTGKMLVHEATGKKISIRALKTLVEKVGQREASRSLGIPRTTIQDWLKSDD